MKPSLTSSIALRVAATQLLFALVACTSGEGGDGRESDPLAESTDTEETQTDGTDGALDDSSEPAADDATEEEGEDDGSPEPTNVTDPAPAVSSTAVSTTDDAPTGEQSLDAGSTGGELPDETSMGESSMGEPSSDETTLDASSDEPATDDGGIDDDSETATDTATGDDEPTVCAEGQEFFHPGCGVDPNPLQAGCYRRCEGDGDASCGPGTQCAVADINPCVCEDLGEGAGCCAACGQELWLCQPEATSECVETEGASISAASDTFGFCAGECRFELTLNCNEASLELSDNLATNSRTNTGVLTASARAMLSELASELTGANLDEVYGCPDCADGGASSITLSTGGKSSTHSYEYGDPPEVFAEADALLRELKTALRECENNEWIDVAADCSVESEDSTLR